jgi:photosystem II stability/assembly factor-like uncharacterized protein
MSNGSTLRALARLAGISLIPLLAASAQPKAPTQSPAASANYRSCWLRDAGAANAKAVYAVCEQGRVWFTTDGGVKWTSSDTGATARLRSIAVLDAHRMIVAGDSGTMLATADGGKTWQTRNSGTKEHLLDIAFQGESGWACGYQGILIHTTDGGRTWTKQTTGTTQTLEAMYFLDANHGWTVGWAGTILITSDGGAKWQAVKTDAASWSLTSVYFHDLKNGWIVGFAGQILRTQDGGLTWKTQPSPVRSWLTNIAFEGPKKGWITFDDGFLTSEDGGQTWTQHDIKGRYFLSKLIPVGDSLWAVGQSAMLQRTGASWKKLDGLTIDDVSRAMSLPLDTSDDK